MIVSGTPLPKGHSFLGRILKATPGDDGVVRKVTVKTKDSLLVRPVTKLCLLEGVVDDDD